MPALVVWSMPFLNDIHRLWHCEPGNKGTLYVVKLGTCTPLWPDFGPKETACWVLHHRTLRNTNYNRTTGPLFSYSPAPHHKIMVSEWVLENPLKNSLFLVFHPVFHHTLKNLMHIMIWTSLSERTVTLMYPDYKKDNWNMIMSQ